MTEEPSSNPVTSEAGIYASSTEILDLGRDRFDRDTAAVGDRDTSLNYAPGTINVREGRAPQGMEAQAWAWKTMQFIDKDRNVKEELKGDLHGGQLHRQNRAARAPEPQPFSQMGGRGGEGGGRGDRGGSEGAGGGRGKAPEEKNERLVAARKPDREVWPLAKGYPEELDMSYFWDEPIV